MKRTRKFKPSYTAKTVLSELAQIQKRISLKRNGYRKELRTGLQQCQVVITQLMGNDAVRKDFENKVRRTRKRNDAPFKLSLEVVAQATDRKRASKYAIVLDLLRAEKVDDKSVAGEIRKRGGFAAIYNKTLATNAEEVTDIENHSGKTKNGPPKPPPNDHPTLLELKLKQSEYEEFLKLDPNVPFWMQVKKIEAESGALRFLALKDHDESDWED